MKASAMTFAAMLLGCTSKDSAGPVGARYNWAPPYPTVCTSAGDDYEDWNMELDGCQPMPGQFSDQKLTFKYSYVLTAHGDPNHKRWVATYEYRYSPNGAAGARRFGVRRVGPLAMADDVFRVSVDSFDITLFRELAGSRFVSYAFSCNIGEDPELCYNRNFSTTFVTEHHIEPVGCVDDTGDSFFLTAAVFCDEQDDLQGTDPNLLPVARYSSSLKGRSVLMGTTLTFVDSSYDSDAQPMTRRWKVLRGGDSVAGYGNASSVQHRFDSAGVYTMRIIVEDVLGGIDVFAGDVIVRSTNSPPSASFTSNLTSGGQAGCQKWRFVASASDADGDALTFDWEFSDSLNARNASSTYERQFCSYGTYLARLVVTDGMGGSNRPTSTFVVAPMAVSIAGPDAVPKSVTCTFYANVTYGLSPYTFQWYRDGVLEPSNTSVYTRASARGYFLEVRVTDSDGRTASATKEVDLLPPTAHCGS